MNSAQLQVRIFHNLSDEEKLYIINNITWIKWWHSLNMITLDELYILSKQPTNSIVKHFNLNHLHLLSEVKLSSKKIARFYGGYYN